jgi:hypothetical protein
MKWFTNVRTKRPARRQERFRLRVEELENRLTPSGWAPIDATAQPVTVAPVPVSQDHLIAYVSPQATMAGGTYVTGAAGTATAEGVAVGADGSVYVTGTFPDPAGPNQIGYVKKYDSTGAVVYMTGFFGFVAAGSATEGTGIAVDGAGNAYVSAKAHDGAAGTDNGMYLAIDPTGTSFVYSGIQPGPGSANGVAVDAAGDAVFVGQSSSYVWAARFTSIGTPVFNMSYPTPLFTGSNANGVAMPASGISSTLGGSVTTTSGVTNSFLATLDASGGLVAANFNSSSTNDTVNAVVIALDGNFIVAGTNDIGGPTQMGIVAKVNTPITAFIWIAPLAGSSSAFGIAQDAGGNVYVTGGDSSGQAYLAQLSSGGTVMDYTVFGGTGGSDVGRAVAVRAGDGHVFAVGITNSSDFPVTDGSTLAGTTDGFLTEWTYP